MGVTTRNIFTAVPHRVYLLYAYGNEDLFIYAETLFSEKSLWLRWFINGEKKENVVSVIFIIIYTSEQTFIAFSHDDDDAKLYSVPSRKRILLFLIKFMCELG